MLYGASIIHHLEERRETLWDKPADWFEIRKILPSNGGEGFVGGVVNDHVLKGTYVDTDVDRDSQSNGMTDGDTDLDEKDEILFLGEDQLPILQLPTVGSNYEGSEEEIVACCTVVEGLIQMNIGLEQFNQMCGENPSPSYVPFLMKGGIPFEKGNVRAGPVRIMGGEIGNGRKVRLLRINVDGKKDLFYTVETQGCIFCRKIHEVKAKRFRHGDHIQMDPEVYVFSTKSYTRMRNETFADIPDSDEDIHCTINLKQFECVWQTFISDVDC